MREWEQDNPDIASQPLIDWDQNILASYSPHAKHNNSLNALQTQNAVGLFNIHPNKIPVVKSTHQPNIQALQSKQKRREWGAPGSSSDKPTSISSKQTNN